MENYKLRADEVVLYKGDVILKNKKGTTELILTNLNIVFINKYKELLSKEEITILEYPVHSIKIYEDVPQIKVNGNTVEIYLLETEIEFKFNSKTELHKFNSVAKKLLTGQTSVERVCKNVKNSIDLIDDTLGINTVQATGDVLKNGIVGNITGAIGKIGKSLFNKNKK